MRENKNKNMLFNLFFSWLFTFSCLRGVISITLLEGGMVETGLICLLFVCLFSFVLFNKKTVLASLALIIAAGLFVFIRITGAEIISPYWLEVYDSLVETKDFVLGYSVFSEISNTITIWLLALLISFISSFLIKMKYSYLFIFAIGTGLFIAVNSADFKGYDYAFLPMLFCLIMLYLKRANKTEAGSSASMKFAPIVILIMAASVYIPMPEKKLTQEQLEQVYEEVYWYFREPFMPKYFSPSNIGFEDEDGKLGGSIDLGEDFVMYVYADNPVYLAGSKRGVYTGRSWVYAGDEEFIPVEDIGLLEEGITGILTLFDYYGYGEEELEQFGIERKSLTVDIGKNRTGSIFTPNNPYDIFFYGDYFPQANSAGDLRVNPVFKVNESYTIDYYDVEYGEYLYNELHGQDSTKGYYKYAADFFKAGYERYTFYDPRLNVEFTAEEILAYYEEGRFPGGSEQRSIQYKTESGVYTNTSLDRIMVFLKTTMDAAKAYENRLVPYSDYVYENYLDLPETLPQRVSDLAYEITEGIKSDYLKMEAIEKYLEENYLYTLTPGESPEGADFVDDFLFESKKGYCTYFASSMAVMARVLGIPSRFAEGYITAGEKAEEGYYTIFSKDAHAWAELYFEGIGWVAFDATPPEFVFTYIYTEEKKKQELAFPMENNIPDEEDMDLYDDDLQDNTEDILNEDGALAYGENGEGEEGINLLGWGILLFLSYVGLRFLYMKAKHKAIEMKKYEKAVMAYYKEMLDVLKFLGFHKKDFETPEGFILRIKDTIPVNYRVLEGATKVYSDARYGIGDIREKELVIARHAYYSFYNAACGDETKIKFFIHRYIKKIY